MTNIRPPLTSKSAVWKCIQTVPMPLLENAVGKTDKKIRKLSCPSSDNEITVRDALKMNSAVFEEAGVAPFTDLFQRNIRDSGARIGSVKESVLIVTGELGKVTNTVLAAFSPDSEAGVEIARSELLQMSMAVEVFRDAVEKLDRAVQAAAKKGKTEKTG